jgi:hypothetical protein
VQPSYNTVRPFLVASIPEFRPRYQEEVRKRGRHPKPYLAFAALNAMVTETLDFDGDPLFLARVFDVFEKMALSGDREVITLLQVGFVENLVKFPKRLAAAWERMGSATQKLTTDTAKAWNREINLPAAARGTENSKAKAQTAAL